MPSKALGRPRTRPVQGRSFHSSLSRARRGAGCRYGSCVRPARSLPEYRAARGTGSILDAIAQPELVAELTRQPVARYGTDAAILFSDIVVPVAAIGFGVDVAPGIGPVVAEPFRTKDDLQAPHPRTSDRCSRMSPKR